MDAKRCRKISTHFSHPTQPQNFIALTTKIYDPGSQTLLKQRQGNRFVVNSIDISHLSHILRTSCHRLDMPDVILYHDHVHFQYRASPH